MFAQNHLADAHLRVRTSAVLQPAGAGSASGAEGRWPRGVRGLQRGGMWTAGCPALARSDVRGSKRASLSKSNNSNSNTTIYDTSKHTSTS